MTTIEQYTNTPEQVENYLRAGLAVVAELSPPDDLREVCFAKACDFLSAKTLIPAPVSGAVYSMPGLGYAHG